VVIITDKAKKYMQEVSKGGYVTLVVKGGGCSGFQYVWGLSSEIKGDDDVIDDILIVDSLTIMYVIGSTIDYVTELGGNFLTVINPIATAQCGCGESFSI
jgi:iron-sulfur cluster assembly accessory protein|tara:strand:+ start:1736 stop:2035 length:300 start_codon:yes stop_codon:yes gene_type:complete